ncbi:MAG: hypothetical protein ACHQYP_06015 [Nitrospiria bacterium]
MDEKRLWTILRFVVSNPDKYGFTECIDIAQNIHAEVERKISILLEKAKKLRR